MKSIIKIVFLLVSVSLFGQTVNMTTDWQKHILNNIYQTESKDSLNYYDFGKLWTETENKDIYGIIGENLDIPDQNARLLRMKLTTLLWMKMTRSLRLKLTT